MGERGGQSSPLRVISASQKSAVLSSLSSHVRKFSISSPDICADFDAGTVIGTLAPPHISMGLFKFGMPVDVFRVEDREIIGAVHHVEFAVVFADDEKVGIAVVMSVLEFHFVSFLPVFGGAAWLVGGSITLSPENVKGVCGKFSKKVCRGRGSPGGGEGLTPGRFL